MEQLVLVSGARGVKKKKGVNGDDESNSCNASNVGKLVTFGNGADLGGSTATFSAGEGTKIPSEVVERVDELILESVPTVKISTPKSFVSLVINDAISNKVDFRSLDSINLLMQKLKLKFLSSYEKVNEVSVGLNLLLIFVIFLLLAFGVDTVEEIKEKYQSNIGAARLKLKLFKEIAAAADVKVKDPLSKGPPQVEDVNLKFLRSTDSHNLAFISSTSIDSTTNSVSAAVNVSVTGRNLGANGPTSMGFDMNKVECYNFHGKGHFARECRSLKDLRRTVVADPQRRNVPTGHESVEARLLVYKQNESVLEENIKLLNIEVQLKDNALTTLRQKLDNTEKERDDLNMKLKNDGDNWSPSNLYDRFVPSGGYHAVLPPVTGTFMPPKPNLVFHTPHLMRMNTLPLMFSSVPLSLNKTYLLDLVHLSLRTRHSDHLPVAPTIPPRTNPHSRGFKRPKKACFVCKSVTHLIKDCDFHARKLTHKPYASRDIHMQYAPVNSSKFPLHEVPTAALSQSQHSPRRPSSYSRYTPPRVTAAESSAVSAAQDKQATWGNPQQALKDKGVIDSGCSRHMTGNMSYLSDFEELNGGYVAFGGNPKGGKITEKGKIKTEKLDFEDVYFVKELKFNLFSVSQMCDKKNNVLFTDTECLVLSSDFKLPDASHVLLRVPRENNMYNVNLRNIVPSGDLTCLFAKATLDESNLSHRRLGHVNFKTINKLVKGNLVRGLPTKVFTNDNSCVACKKGKQHRASCKSKTVFFLASKDETAPVLKTFIIGLENLLSLKVKVIRCDNGTEFKNFNLNQFCSKAFRVFNSRTRIVLETLHVNFMENKPNVAGSGPDWLFDIDSLTRTMNCHPVIAENQTNTHAGNKTENKDKGKSPVVTITGFRNLNAEFEECTNNSSNRVNAASSSVSTAGHNFINITIDFSAADDVGAEADINNLESIISVSPIPTTRIHQDHPTSQIIVYQMDVKSAFLYGTIEEEVYVCQPPGFQDLENHDKVYKVVKALYGLHQAPRAWYETLATYLLENRFQRGTIDQTLFIKKQQKDILLVQIYVDDIIFGATNKALCQSFEKLMKDKFQMSSMGELTFFLGLQVKQKKDVIFISQDKYVADILRKFGLFEGKSASTPIDSEKPLLKDSDGEDVDVHTYRLQALVDQKKIVISEVVIREILQLDDAEGIVCLPNEEIFAVLAQMGYKKPSTKLTFYKAFFSSQWKFLIHTILQSFSAKRTSWNEFSTAMASAVICLSKGQTFNFSKYIFDSLVRNVDNSSKFYMYPRFIQLIIQNQVGDLSTHTKRFISLALTQKDVPHDAIPSPPSPDIPSLSQAQTTPPQQPHISPQVPPQGADFPAHFQQVLDTCSALIRRIKHLEHDNIAHNPEIVKLKERGRMINEDEGIELVNDADSADAKGRQADKQAEIYHIDLDHPSKVLSMQEDDSKVQEVVEVVTTAKLMTDVVTAAASQVSAASATIPAAKLSIPAAAPIVVAPYTRRRKGVIIRDPEEEVSLKTPAETPSLKDSSKGILVESPKPMKKKDQIELDAEYVRKLHEEINKDDAEFNKDIDWHAAIDHKAAKRRKLNEKAQEAEGFKKQLEIVNDEDDNVFTKATPLGRKVPVVDYKIVMINNKPRYKIIRVYDTHQLYISFITLLKNFDREDLEDLWRIVKERFSTSKPSNFFDDYLLATLKTMFEKTDGQDVVWRNQNSIYGQALSNIVAARLKLKLFNEIAAAAADVKFSYGGGGDRITGAVDLICVLARTMNYHPVIAENQSNTHAGFQDTEKAGEEGTQSYVLFPVLSDGSINSQTNNKDAHADGKEHDDDIQKYVSPNIHSSSSGAQTRIQSDKTENKDKEDIQCAGSDTRPPMLDRTNFVSWQQRIRLYCRGKDNGVNILKSIDEGPYKLGTLRETLAESIEGTPQFGLPKDIYTLINHYTYAKDIWDDVKMLPDGSELTKEEREFTKLINDMRNIKMTMSKLQLNSKFVNNMLPEWGRYVTAVKLNKGLKDSNYDQLYAYLKQHETHAKDNKMILECFSQPTVDPLALLSNVSNPQHYSPPSSASSSTQVPLPLADSSSLAEDLIENLTNTLALLTQSYRTFLPQTNNQLRTSSNARNQATVQDGKVVVQNGQARPGQARTVKCYNCNGTCHIAWNYTQPKQPQNSEYFKDKMLLMQAQENGVALDAEQLLFLAGGPDNAFDDDVDEQPVQDLVLNVDNVFQAEDCDAFDSDVDEAPTAQTMFMANLSSADPITNKARPSYDLNILSEYVKDNEVPVVHSVASYVPNDTFMMIYNDMCEPSAPSVSNSSWNAVVKNSLTAELATYREQVELYERRAKFKLTER
nr:ribonuclease H-like domain-containing protein [Tanacetum cinerariifolium]